MLVCLFCSYKIFVKYLLRPAKIKIILYFKGLFDFVFCPSWETNLLQLFFVVQKVLLLSTMRKRQKHLTMRK